MAKNLENYELSGMKQNLLIERFQTLVRSERKTTAEIVEYIKEIDRRKIYLKLGYGSLFSYLTEGVGYSSSSAMRRISAARLVAVIPELKTDLQSGALNLMQMSVVAQGIRQKEKEGAKMAHSEKANLLSKIKTLDTVQTQKVVAQELNLKVQTQEIARVQADESLRIACTLTKEQSEKIEKARQLLSHKYPGASWSDLISAFAEDVIRLRSPHRQVRKYVKKNKNSKPPETKNHKQEATGESTSSGDQSFHLQDSRKEGAARMAQAASQNVDMNSNFSIESRRILTAETRRQVFKKSEMCQYIDSTTQKQCSSKHQLQIDHIVPVWAGGTNSVDNLQILCAQHNRLKYKMQSNQS